MELFEAIIECHPSPSPPRISSNIWRADYPRAGGGRRGATDRWRGHPLPALSRAVTFFTSWLSFSRWSRGCKSSRCRAHISSGGMRDELRRVGWGCWFIWHRGLGLRPGTLSLLFLSWQLYFGKSDTTPIYIMERVTPIYTMERQKSDSYIDYLVRKGWHLFLFGKSDTISTQEPS